MLAEIVRLQPPAYRASTGEVKDLRSVVALGPVSCPAVLRFRASFVLAIDRSPEFTVQSTRVRLRNKTRFVAGQVGESLTESILGRHALLYLQQVERGCSQHGRSQSHQDEHGEERWR